MGLLVLNQFDFWRKGRDVFNQSKSVTKLLCTTGFCLSIECRFSLFPIVTNGNYHSVGEALDIYDILKLTHNGILEEDTDTEQDRTKGGISQSSKWGIDHMKWNFHVV